ncbi:MAG TPA: tetratricopeptide repeat protein [Spirochaetota bacterium]|nr:tetratricopeptide repeat protein [Spirochaetota bacterium]
MKTIAGTIVSAASTALVCIVLSVPAFASDSVPEAIATMDEDDVVLNARGIGYLRENDLEAAERCFSESIKKNPTIKHYYNNLAVTCMRRKEYARAYELLKKAVSMDPRYAKALSNMSITCFYLSRFYEAYGYYMQARNADRVYIDERFERSRVIERIKELQRENPGNDDYRKMLDRLRSQDKALQ